MQDLFQTKIFISIVARVHNQHVSRVHTLQTEKLCTFFAFSSQGWLLERTPFLARKLILE